MRRSTTILVWNEDNPKREGPKFYQAWRELAATDADIIILSEGNPGTLPDGHRLVSPRQDRPGISKDCHDVVLWSREKWRDVYYGTAEMAFGCFICATTLTASGPLTVAGVCIPYDGLNATRGRKDRKLWEEHLKYLHELRKVLPQRPEKLVVAGDFNQGVPPRPKDKGIASKLTDTFRSMDIITTGLSSKNIDHVALSRDLKAAKPPAWRDTARDGTALYSKRPMVIVEITGLSF